MARALKRIAPPLRRLHHRATRQRDDLERKGYLAPVELHAPRSKDPITTD